MQSTNLLKKAHDLLEPDFKKARVGPVCEFADSTHVRIRGTATTEPKGISGEKAWDGSAEVIWDIPNAKFSSQKVTRKFAGVRKESNL